MVRVARGMTALDLELDAILTSPLLRAKETAEIVADALDLHRLLREAPVLGGGCMVGDLQSLLRDQPRRARVLLVGHEPDFGNLVSGLIGGGRVRMRKASLACLEVDRVEPGGGELRWFLTPDQLARLRQS